MNSNNILLILHQQNTVPHNRPAGTPALHGLLVCWDQWRRYHQMGVTTHKSMASVPITTLVYMVHCSEHSLATKGLRTQWTYSAVAGKPLFSQLIYLHLRTTYCAASTVRHCAKFKITFQNYKQSYVNSLPVYTFCDFHQSVEYTTKTLTTYRFRDMVLRFTESTTCNLVRVGRYHYS